MQARDCRQRIIALKEWRMHHGKTIDECIEICGNYPADATIRRMLGKGGEDKTFRESTVAAVELALMGKVYEPEIKIPVMDVVRAQEATAKQFAAENRQLRYQVQRQSHIITGLLALALCSLIFFGGIAIYDFCTNGTGFWNSDASWIWVVKVSFLICVALVLLRLFVKIRQLNAQFAAEEVSE